MSYSDRSANRFIMDLPIVPKHQVGLHRATVGAVFLTKIFDFDFGTFLKMILKTNLHFTQKAVFQE